MMKTAYSVELPLNEKKIAKAIITNAAVSWKYSNEICRELKGKTVTKAQTFLENIKVMKSHLPLRVYRHKVGHRKGNTISGVKSGRYPIRACTVFLNLLQSVKANADYKGLDAENLMITHAFASRGFARTSSQSQGKIGGKQRKGKSAHLEVVVHEVKA